MGCPTADLHGQASGAVEIAAAEEWRAEGDAVEEEAEVAAGWGPVACAATRSEHMCENTGKVLPFGVACLSVDRWSLSGGQMGSCTKGFGLTPYFA